MRAAARTDIVIIDWWINDTTGDRALEAIARTVANDQRARRLIAVYTTQRALGRIADRIRVRLGIDGSSDREDDELTLDVGGVRIVILNKGHVRIADEYRGNQVTQDALPRRLVTEFRLHTGGLVPAVALNALAAARENTHRILQRLGTKLDIGYAGHLLRIEHLEDGAAHLTDAMADELRAVIEDDVGTREAAGALGITAWLDQQESQFRTSREVIDTLFAINTAEQSELDAARRSHKSLQQIGEEDFSSLLVASDDAALARRSDAEVAMLLSLRHSWGVQRLLQLGTIVREDCKDGRYWLCVQPVCDSVRLDSPRRFPMLRIEDWEHDMRKKQFHIVAPASDSQEAPIHLWAANKPQDIGVFEVAPTEGRAARFVRQNNAEPHLRTIGGPNLIWIAQLKPAHAQRVAEQLGGNLTRVGLDESEWLRQRGHRRNEQPGDSLTPAQTFPSERGTAGPETASGGDPAPPPPTPR